MYSLSPSIGGFFFLNRRLTQILLWVDLFVPDKNSRRFNPGVRIGFKNRTSIIYSVFTLKIPQGGDVKVCGKNTPTGGIQMGDSFF